MPESVSRFEGGLRDAASAWGLFGKLWDGILLYCGSHFPQRGSTGKRVSEFVLETGWSFRCPSASKKGLRRCCNAETKENTNQINELNLTANESLNTTEKEKEQNNNVVEENIQETENSDTENEISVESVENSNEVQVETKEERIIEDGYYYIRDRKSVV